MFTTCGASAPFLASLSASSFLVMFVWAWTLDGDVLVRFFNSINLINF